MKISKDFFKDNPRQTMAIIAGVGAILLFFYFTLLIKPQLIAVSSIMVKINKTTQGLRVAEKDIAGIDETKKNIESRRLKVESYENRLPAEQEIPSLLENLSDMAKQSKVKIVGITPVMMKEDKDRPPQTYKEIPILISAKSGYHELGSFLGNLEGSDRFMKVVDIDIKSNKAAPKRHDVELLVLTYVLLKGK